MYRKKTAIRTVLAFLSSPFFFTLSFCGFASLERERKKERKGITKIKDIIDDYDKSVR
jgi:hypothetical protein